MSTLTENHRLEDPDGMKQKPAEHLMEDGGNIFAHGYTEK